MTMPAEESQVTWREYDEYYGTARHRDFDLLQEYTGIIDFMLQALDLHENRIKVSHK